MTGSGIRIHWSSNRTLQISKVWCSTVIAAIEVEDEDSGVVEEDCMTMVVVWERYPGLWFGGESTKSLC